MAHRAPGSRASVSHPGIGAHAASLADVRLSRSVRDRLARQFGLERVGIGSARGLGDSQLLLQALDLLIADAARRWDACAVRKC